MLMYHDLQSLGAGTRLTAAAAGPPLELEPGSTLRLFYKTYSDITLMLHVRHVSFKYYHILAFATTVTRDAAAFMFFACLFPPHMSHGPIPLPESGGFS